LKFIEDGLDGKTHSSAYWNGYTIIYFYCKKHFLSVVQNFNSGLYWEFWDKKLVVSSVLSVALSCSSGYLSSRIPPGVPWQAQRAILQLRLNRPSFHWPILRLQSVLIVVMRRRLNIYFFPVQNGQQNASVTWRFHWHHRCDTGQWDWGGISHLFGASAPASHVAVVHLSLQHVGFTSGAPSHTEVCQIVVPDTAVGAIIGSGGSMIKQIMEDSGAHVTVCVPAALMCVWSVSEKLSVWCWC